MDFVHKHEIKLTDEEATNFFKALKKDLGKLSDDELELVAGGAHTKTQYEK